MNPQTLSLDFTNTAASKSSANAVTERREAGDDQFKKELSKQEKSTRQDESGKAKPETRPEQKSDELAPKTEERVSIAADEVQNGEELPETETLTESLIQPIQPALLINDLDSPALQAMPESDLPLDLGFATSITGLDISIVDEGSDQASLLLSQVTMSPDEIALTQDGRGITSGPMLMNAATTPENPLVSTSLSDIDGVAGDDILSRPVEKLMTLNQIMSSLESSLETMAELEVDVDTESTIKEVMRFNDVQLKESQTGLKSYTTSVPVPMTQTAWGEQVSDKIVWLANQKIQYAEIHINPQELGPVEVKINVQNEQTSITFISPHQGVRDLLEMNVNRLREMMGENGVDLAHVDVSDQSSQQESQGDENDNPAGMATDGGSGVDLESSEATTLSIEQENLVDYYA